MLPDAKLMVTCTAEWSLVDRQPQPQTSVGTGTCKDQSTDGDSTIMVKTIYKDIARGINTSDKTQEECSPIQSRIQLA